MIRPLVNLMKYFFQDIPPVKAFSPGTYAKRGFLLKLEVGHRIILGHKKWQRRFCILTRDKLFIYHNEMSNGCEKGTCYLDLQRFVRCQRIPSKHGNYYEFSLFASSEQSSNSMFKRNVCKHYELKRGKSSISAGQCNCTVYSKAKINVF